MHPHSFIVSFLLIVLYKADIDYLQDTYRDEYFIKKSSFYIIFKVDIPY